MKGQFLILILAITSSCQAPISDEQGNTPFDTADVNQRPENSKITLKDILKVKEDFIDLSAFDQPSKDTLFIEYITDGDTTVNYIDPSPLFDAIKTKALSIGFKTVLKYESQYIYTNKPGPMRLVPDNAAHYFIQITAGSNKSTVIQTYRYPLSIGGQTFKETTISL